MPSTSGNPTSPLTFNTFFNMDASHFGNGEHAFGMPDHSYGTDDNFHYNLGTGDYVDGLLGGQDLSLEGVDWATNNVDIHTYGRQLMGGPPAQSTPYPTLSSAIANEALDIPTGLPNIPFGNALSGTINPDVLAPTSSYRPGVNHGAGAGGEQQAQLNSSAPTPSEDIVNIPSCENCADAKVECVFVPDLRTSSGARNLSCRRCHQGHRRCVPSGASADEVKLPAAPRLAATYARSSGSDTDRRVSKKRPALTLRLGSRDYVGSSNYAESSKSGKRKRSPSLYSSSSSDSSVGAIEAFRQAYSIVRRSQKEYSRAANALEVAINVFMDEGATVIAKAEMGILKP